MALFTSYSNLLVMGVGPLGDTDGTVIVLLKHLMLHFACVLFNINTMCSLFTGKASLVWNECSVEFLRLEYEKTPQRLFNSASDFADFLRIFV